MNPTTTLRLTLLLLGYFASQSLGRAKDPAALLDELAQTDDEKLAERLRETLKHFQTEDPVGLPGELVPDPLPIPDIRRTLPIGTVRCRHINVHGLSRFRFKKIHFDITELQVLLRIAMEELQVVGRYDLRQFLHSRSGDFAVRLMDVRLAGSAALHVNRTGFLQTTSIDLDMSFRDLDLDFEGLFFVTLVKNVLDGLGALVFEGIKPFVLRVVNHNIRDDLNLQLQRIPRRFPNSAAPIDMAVVELRRQVRGDGYDPIRLPDRGIGNAYLHANLSDIRVTGLASFHRTGDLVVDMENHVVRVTLDFATGRLAGSFQWRVVGFGDYLDRRGDATLTVDGVRVKATFNQHTDTRRKPQLEDFHFVVGNVTAQIDGAGTLDYLFDAVLNVLPNLLREGVEEPLRKKVTQELEDVDIEQLIESRLPSIRKRVKAVRKQYSEAETAGVA